MTTRFNLDEEQKSILKKPIEPVTTNRSHYHSDFDNKAQKVKMYRAGTMDENINSQNNKQIDRGTKSDINHPAPTPRSSYVASFP